MMNTISLALTLLQTLAVLGQEAPTPVVLWHGMGDSAAGMIGIAVWLFSQIYSWSYTL